MRHDSRGSVHILEVMIVALMVVGAIVSVSTMNANVSEAGRRTDSVQEDKADELLSTLRGLPATNTSVHYTDRLEEMIVQHMAGGDDALPTKLRNHHATEHRMMLQVEGRNHLVVGSREIPSGDIPHGGSAFWYSELGQTLIRPTVSHVEPGMDAQFELLPAWIDRVAKPPGHAYEVDLEFSDPDLDRASTFFHRLPLADQHPLILEPTDRVVDASHIINGEGTHYEWDLELKLAPLAAQTSTWLGTGQTFEVLAGQEWDLSLPDEEEADWVLTSDADDPVWILEYAGRPQRGPDTEAWLNVTLERPTHEAVTHHEVVLLRSGSSQGGEASVVLTPDSPSGSLPGLVFTSQPSPFPVTESVPLVFTVTNPTGSSVTMDAFSVRFSAGHQFKQEPAGWSRLPQDDGSVTYAWDSPASIAAHDAITLELPVQVENGDEGDNIKRGVPPVLEHLGPGELDPPLRDGLLPDEDGVPPLRSVSHPLGDAGVYTAWLRDEDREAGPHTVRVGHVAEDHVPPGAATFTQNGTGSSGFLPDLQQARQGMRLAVNEATFTADEDLGLTFSTAGLVEALQDHSGALTGEPIRLEVRAGDLLGQVNGNPENVTVEQWDLSQMTPGMEVDLNLAFSRSTMQGPVLVDAKWVVPTVDHGEVGLNFLAHALRTDGSRTVTPVFFNAHLQFWLPEGRGAWEVDV